MLDDLALFVHIVQNHGLTGAATRLNMPPATVTRRLRRLEERIGRQLLHRSARKFALTSEGEAYYQAFADLIYQCEAAIRSLDADMHQLTGRLVVTAPTNLSTGILQPMWSSFIQTYPDIQLDLRLSNEVKDMLELQADLAIRIGPQTDTGLYQKRLGTVSTIIAAAPDYLDRNGRPETPNDLQLHRLIAIRTVPIWQLRQERNPEQTETLSLSAATSVDDIALATEFACAGLGIALLPVVEAVEQLESGKLERILTSWRGPDRDVFAVWPTGRLLSARARCLLDFLQAFVAGHPVLHGQVPDGNTWDQPGPEAGN